jgi:hypothetical protein
MFKLAVTAAWIAAFSLLGVGLCSAQDRVITHRFAHSFELPDRGPTMNDNGCFLERVASHQSIKVCIT